MAAIRVVDIGKIGLGSSEPSPEQLLSVGRDITDSFRSTGFAYLHNHGISQQLQDNTFTVAERFFDLDDDKKLAYERFVKTGYNGYTPIAGENTACANDKKASVTDYKEIYDLRYYGEDYPDAVVPEFGPQLERIGSACCRLSSRLLAALDAALGCGQLLTSCHQRQLQPGGWSHLRLLHYPPVPADVGDNATRCGVHTDFSTITLLFQHGIGGLEVETSEGVWVAAEPIPGTILANIGDMMELWTAGDLRATKHRVLMPENESARQASRQSMVFFVQPDDGTTVAPTNGDPRYQPVDYGNVVSTMFSATYPTFPVFCLSKKNMK